jgi:hypothetical protein
MSERLAPAGLVVAAPLIGTGVRHWLHSISGVRQKFGASVERLIE